jgi:hypothetical protein
LDWLTFSSQLVGSLAWPVVVLGCVLLLRRSVLSLLPTLRSAKYGGLELEFGKRLMELESKAATSGLPEPTERPAWVYESPDDWTFGEYIERLAPISPRMAIVEAWRSVEMALRGAARSTGPNSPRDLMTIAAQLQSEGALPINAVTMLNDLRKLRNQAVHANEMALEPDQAIEFARIAERVIASIWTNKASTESESASAPEVEARSRLRSPTREPRD